MANTNLPLTIALSSYPHLIELKNGKIPIAGVTATFLDFPRMVVAFRRMVREVAFDVSEMAPTTYLIARALGAPYIALPIFVMRNFHYSGLVCRPDAHIITPKDLEGRKVGVRAYSVTSATWTRQILADEFGVDCSRITWVVADEEHVTAIPLPHNVSRAPAGRTLAEMMADGELHAAFSGAPGTGTLDPGYHELFANAAELEAAAFRRSGIYPLHGLIVVKEELLSRHNWLADSILHAFVEAKERYLSRLFDEAANGSIDQRYRHLSTIVGDPLPYGFEKNRLSIEALINATIQQGLLPRAIPMKELFLELNS